MFTRLTGQLYFLDIAKIHMVMIRLVCLTNVFDQNTIFGMLMNLVLNFKNDDTHQFAKVASSKKMPIIYFWRIVLSFLTHRLDHNCHLRMCVNTGTDGNVVFLIYIYIIIYIYIYICVYCSCPYLFIPTWCGWYVIKDIFETMEEYISVGNPHVDAQWAHPVVTSHFCISFTRTLQNNTQQPAVMFN